MREYEFDENACIILEWREQFFWDTPYKVLSSERQERKLGIRGGTGGKKEERQGERENKEKIHLENIGNFTDYKDRYFFVVCCLLAFCLLTL